MSITDQLVNLFKTSESNPFKKHPFNNQKGSFQIILGALVLLLVVGGGAYYLGTKNSNSQNQATNINTTPPIQPSSTQVYSEPNSTAITTKNGVAQYQHPQSCYTLEYPASYKSETIPFTDDRPGVQKPDCDDFVARSSDYQSSEDYFDLEKGAEFSVGVENSTEKSIDDIFNKDLLGVQIAKNKVRTTVDGVDAIQYDYSYENHTATMTIFLKNGKYYTIKYRYVDDTKKQSEWDNYLNLLKSFKAK